MRAKFDLTKNATLNAIGQAMPVRVRAYVDALAVELAAHFDLENQKRYEEMADLRQRIRLANNRIDRIESWFDDRTERIEALGRAQKRRIIEHIMKQIPDGPDKN